GNAINFVECRNLRHPLSRPEIRTQTYAEPHIALGSFTWLTVGCTSIERSLVPTPTTRHGSIGCFDRARPLPNVAGHVVDAERAARSGMRADFVGTERERIAPVCHIDVGVIGRQRLTPGEDPCVCATRGALPFVFVAQARTREPLRAIQPHRISGGVVER